jgi:hypothetical protein
VYTSALTAKADPESKASEHHHDWSRSPRNSPLRTFATTCPFFPRGSSRQQELQNFIKTKHKIAFFLNNQIKNFPGQHF